MSGIGKSGWAFWGVFVFIAVPVGRAMVKVGKRLRGRDDEDLLQDDDDLGNTLAENAESAFHR